jgi:hypothetical protein
VFDGTSSALLGEHTAVVLGVLKIRVDVMSINHEDKYRGDTVSKYPKLFNG